MNELLFLFHIFVIGSCVVYALHQGREALTTFVALCWVIANIFIVKQIDLFGLTVTATDVFAIGGMLGLNILQEYFGRDAARRAVNIGLAALVFLACVSLIQVWYVPSSVDYAHTAYRTILLLTPRIVAASFMSFFVVSHVEVWLYGLLQKYCGTRHVIVRNYTSLTITQLIDTLLFSFLGLYGVVDHIDHIILMSFAVKCIIIFCAAPFTALAQRVVPK